MAEQIDRRQKKWEADALLRSAQVSPKQMTAFYLLLVLALDVLDCFDFHTIMGTFVSIFVSILCMLLSIILAAGFRLYLMAIRRGERSEFLTLFDGFSFVGKLIGLEIVTSIFITLWAMLFFIPGIIAAYRYRFATYNLLENPDIGIMEAISMSKQQTYGYKAQLFMLDLSYFGWSFLSALPTLIMTVVVSSRLPLSLSMQGVSNYAGLTDSATIALYLGIPAVVWVIIQGLWSLVVGVCYLSKYYCVDLAYFETAKRTSHVGANVPPPEDHGYNGWKGPDGLGGF